jgi:hypothetical protein
MCRLMISLTDGTRMTVVAGQVSYKRCNRVEICSRNISCGICVIDPDATRGWFASINGPI